MAEKRTKEQIDKLNEFNRSHNQPEVQYEHEDAAGSDEEKEKLRIAAEKKKTEDEAAEVERLRILNESQKVEITEESALAYINKTTGKNFKTLAEAVAPVITEKDPTEEEIKAQQEQREANKLALGLKTGKINPKNVEDFVNDTKNRTEVAFQNYLSEQISDDPTLKEEDVRDEFEEKFGLGKNATPRQKKYGEKQIALLSENIIREKHKPFYELENQYSEVERSEAATKAKAEKMQTLAPKYKKDVEEAFAEVKTVRVKLSDKEIYDVEVPQNLIDELLPLFISDTEISKNVEAGWDKKDLIVAARAAINTHGLDSIVLSAAQKYLNKHKAGTRGIVQLDGTEGEDQPEVKELTPAQQRAKDRIYGEGEFAN